MGLQNSNREEIDITKKIKHFEKVAEACITSTFAEITYLSLSMGVGNFDSKAIERNYKTILEDDFNYYLGSIKNKDECSSDREKVLESIENMVKLLNEVKQEGIKCLGQDKQEDIVNVIESLYNSLNSLLVALRDNVNNKDCSQSQDEFSLFKFQQIP